MIRLVKGAYWDSEIKRAQMEGLEGYPVYTRKVYTDVSYLACAKKLLGVPNLIYPQFATHNAHTLGGDLQPGGSELLSGPVRVPVSARHGRTAVRAGDR
ncbi:proline dehydrogenase family protein [Enterobacter hormaechei]|uniref:Proline dehydrogenase family protein n=1 Tax=Enterobacter hormaechei TaxID=158836 RepID=A0A927HKT7_9ENTR|nr:proline dehydrogenase family protein [Enterobacter hormaechei]